jgi:hypothetical protein
MNRIHKALQLVSHSLHDKFRCRTIRHAAMDKHTRRLRNRHELIVFIEDGNQNVFVNGDLFAHETSSGYNWPASDTQESGAGTVLGKRPAKSVL